MFDCVAQAQQQVPTVTIDKTDGCQMYLSEQSKEAEIVSAKSSEMNIVIPDKNGEFVSDVTLSNVYVLTTIVPVYFVMVLFC